MANPNPEIMPDAAKAAGVRVVGTGRSDFPNQVNNVLAFPGIFKGGAFGARPRYQRRDEAGGRACAGRAHPGRGAEAKKTSCPKPSIRAWRMRWAGAVAKAARESGVARV